MSNTKQIGEVYKCDICGNIVQINHVGKGKLVCCGKPMQLLEEKTSDPEVGEKHVPVIEQSGDVIKVKIGEVAHPMEAKHYIEWIEIIADKRYYKKFLRPSDKPEAEFEIKANHISARAYCNIHGLWKK
jgi:superoxide reductase